MTPEQAARLRKARDTMPEHLLVGVLFQEDEPEPEDNGVCAVGHLCVFADIPIDWFRDDPEPSIEVRLALQEFYGWHGISPASLDYVDWERVMTANDGALDHVRRNVVVGVLNNILRDHGYEP